MTTRHDIGGLLGWPLDTFFWALTMSWSRLLARVCGVALSVTCIIVSHTMVLRCMVGYIDD